MSDHLLLLQVGQAQAVPGAMRCASHWPAEPASTGGGQRAGVRPHHPAQSRAEGAIASTGHWYLGAHSVPLAGSAPPRSEAHGSPTKHKFSFKLQQ